MSTLNHIRPRLAVYLTVLAACAALTSWAYSAAEHAPYGAADQFYAVWRSDSIDRAPVGVDDANIFFVYGRNLADGDGLVWNEGGERVEGYSSTLWLAIVTPLFALGLPVEKTLTAISVLLTAAALTLLALELERQLRGETDPTTAWLGSAAVVVWSLAVPGYVVWCCLTLMDTGLWSAVLIAATVALLAEIRSHGRPRYRRAMAALVVALLLARPEGMLWAGFFAALYAAVVALRTRNWQAGRRSFFILLVPYLATLAAITVFRLAYFGYSLPNTFYAKVAPSLVYNLTTGGPYLLQFMGSNPLLWIVAAAIVLATARSSRALLRGRGSEAGRRRDMAILAVSMVVALGLAVPVLEGGDHFVLYRFYQPIWPLLIVPLLLSAAQLAPQRLSHFSRSARLALGGVATIGGALLLIGLNEVSWTTLASHDIQIEFRYAQEGREAGEYLNRALAGGRLPSVGTIASGGFGYAYRGETVDLMGLNLVEMAHEPGDRQGIKDHAAFSPAVFYRLQPEILIPWLVPSPQRLPPYFTFPWFTIPLKNVQNQPRFRELYDLAVIRSVGSSDPVYLSGLFRRDYLADLERDGRFEIDRPLSDSPQR